MAIKHLLLAIAFSLIAFADGRIYQHAKSEFELGSYVVLRINKIEFPAVEHVTVISGTFQIGMGDQFDESKLNPLIAGTFGFLAPKMNHFAMAKGDTVIQLHGIGPWQINYVNPVDDPRKKLFSRF